MTIKFNQDMSVLEFENGSEAFVAMSDIEGTVHVGFAWKKGKSPTNAFEELASFIWKEYYPNRNFNKFVWYDFHRPISANGKNTDDNTAFNILPVVIETSPEWGTAISFCNLPTEFRDRVRQSLIFPAREQGII